MLYVYLSHTRKKKIGLKYYISGHRILINVLYIFHVMKYRASIFNRKISKWESHAEYRNVDQTLVAYN